MTVREHHQAITEAKALFQALTDNPNTGQRALGKGRDLLNQVTNSSNATTIQQAITSLRSIANR